MNELDRQRVDDENVKLFLEIAKNSNRCSGFSDFVEFTTRMMTVFIASADDETAKRMNHHMTETMRGMLTEKKGTEKMTKPQAKKQSWAKCMRQWVHFRLRAG